MSVIVPAYNAAESIGEALESVRSQSFSDWEIVVCDDGSRDGTAAIAQRVGARIVRHAENRGLAVARNAAINVARGELLALLDADDVWLPEYLDRQVALLDASAGKVGIVVCDAYLEDANGRLPGTYSDRYGRPDGVSLKTLFETNPIFVSALLPRNVIDEVGMFAADLRRCEDLDLWIRLVEAGYQVVANREPLVVYRLSPGQLSAQTAAMARARRAVYERALARGRLGRPEQRAAWRAIRRERAAERLTEWQAGRRRLRDLPLFALAIAESPRRLMR